MRVWRRAACLQIPLLDRQRVSDGEPIAMDFKIGGFAREE